MIVESSSSILQNTAEAIVISQTDSLAGHHDLGSLHMLCLLTGLLHQAFQMFLSMAILARSIGSYNICFHHGCILHSVSHQLAI